MVKASKKKRVKKGAKKKGKKSTKKKTRKKTKRSSKSNKHPTKSVKVDKALIDNFVGLQKVMVNLSSKFDSLSTQISKLLELFEISAKSLAQKDFEKDRKGKESKEILKKLDNISQQAGLIGKGLVLIHEASSGKGFDTRQKRGDRFKGMTPSMSMKPSVPPKEESSTREIGGGERMQEGMGGKSSGQTREISGTPGQETGGMSKSLTGASGQEAEKTGQKPFIPSIPESQGNDQSSNQQQQGLGQQNQQQSQQNQMGSNQNQTNNMQSQDQNSQQNFFSQLQQNQDQTQSSENKESQQQGQETQTP